MALSIECMPEETYSDFSQMERLIYLRNFFFYIGMILAFLSKLPDI